jgi:hypothetical protein
MRHGRHDAQRLLRPPAHPGGLEALVNDDPGLVIAYPPVHVGRNVEGETVEGGTTTRDSMTGILWTTSTRLLLLLLLFAMFMILFLRFRFCEQIL